MINYIYFVMLKQIRTWLLSRRYIWADWTKLTVDMNTLLISTWDKLDVDEATTG